MNKDTLKLFISIIAGLGLGVVLTYAFNTNASGLSSSLTVDYGAAFNALSTITAEKKVTISGTSGNIGVGIGAVEPTSKIQIASNGITGIKVNTSGATSDTVSGSLGVVSGSDAGWGVTGYSSNSNGSGVWGYGNGGNVGVLGSTNYGGAGNGIGVYGISGVGIGVKGQSSGSLSDSTSYDFYGSGPKTYFAGNVGIGVTIPGAKLEVAGRIYQSGLGFSTFIGYQAGRNDDSTNNYNTALGYEALYSNTGGYNNTALGHQALYSNTGGYENTALGYQSLYRNTGGFYNTALGYQTLYSNTTGYGNTALGYQALYRNTTSNNNIAIGRFALFDNTTGYDNTALGYQALNYNTTGFYNTVLGAYADTASSGLTNATAIGFSATVDASNKVRIGNTTVTSIGGQVGWSNFSDARGKYDVKDYAHGLDLITKLRSVEFKLKDDASEKIHSGFIAQEVEAIGVPFYGLNKPETEKAFYSLTYSEFVVPLVNSVQEQQKQIEELKKEIEILKQSK